MPVVAFAEGGAPAEEPLITTERIVNYAKNHLEEISVIVTMILTVFYNVRKHRSLNRSIGTLNNNAVTVSENSSKAVNSALAGVEAVSAVVGGYKTEIANLIAEIRKSDGEKKQLEGALASAQEYLTSAKLANVEFANELAELLVLANIPNAKKEELYARHRAAVDAISTAEKAEVKDDDGKEA
jgi:hypothetical protein